MDWAVIPGEASIKLRDSTAATTHERRSRAAGNPVNGACLRLLLPVAPARAGIEFICLNRPEGEDLSEKASPSGRVQRNGS